MGTTTDPGIISLTAKQLQTARGAVNAVVELIDAPDVEIDDQFDPVRRDHAVAVGDSLAEAQLLIAADGNWSGRVSPSEQQALRDALGAIEAMVTPPRSARLDSIPMRIDDDDMRKLSAALDGVPAPDREDLAWSDFRFGGSDRALRDRTRYDENLSTALEYVHAPVDPDADLDRISDRAFPDDPLCSNADLALIEIIALGARLTDAGRGPRHDAARALPDTVDRLLAAAQDCYTEMDTRRITTAAQRTALAVRNGEAFAENHALGAVEMIAWAESTRERERRIGLR